MPRGAPQSLKPNCEPVSHSVPAATGSTKPPSRCGDVLRVGGEGTNQSRRACLGEGAQGPCAALQWQGSRAPCCGAQGQGAAGHTPGDGAEEPATLPAPRRTPSGTSSMPVEIQRLEHGFNYELLFSQRSSEAGTAVACGISHGVREPGAP